MAIGRLLIANRGEVAVRIARTAEELGIESVCVHTEDDRASLHVLRSARSVLLPKTGVSGYLDIDALLDVAAAEDCEAVHPGWGFLSENPEFAARCKGAGIGFIGPATPQLEVFGNKIEARRVAIDCDVPVIAATESLSGPSELLAFIAKLDGATVVLKAASGGGGRGMHVIEPSHADIESTFARSRGEALASFGDDTVYAEQYVPGARHVEVQIVGDGNDVRHLFDRDCSVQRRHQKIIEIAPAPMLSEPLLERLRGAAERIGRATGYRGVGTVEFLVDAHNERFYFLEVNPRLQVEHTVTEAVLDIDLVAVQLAIAAGAPLEELDIDWADLVPRGYAIQLRINAETMRNDGVPVPASGRLARFDVPNGRGIRVDTAAYAGYELNPNFDSLLAKLIVHGPKDDFSACLERAERAARDFQIEGAATNIAFLRAIAASLREAPQRLATTLVSESLAELLVGSNQLDSYALPNDRGIGASVSSARADYEVPEGTVAVNAPMRASVVSIEASIGERVVKGQEVAVLEAMKMHHSIVADVTGTIHGWAAEVGDTLAETAPIVFIEPEVGATEDAGVAHQIDLDATRSDLDEVVARHALGLDENRPAAVARRRKIASRTARENVADLCDDDSFIEYGALTIAAQRRRRSLEDLMENTPADGMIAGVGTVNADLFGSDATRCGVMAYDYTVLAGTQGHMNHKKKDRLFELARDWELPLVFFTEGGGGRPGDVDTDDIIMGWLDLTTFTTWPQSSGLAPRIAINSGRCFAGNAVVFGCADVTIATANSNIGLAGPAMIEGGGLGKFTPEDIGPIDVQTANGVVDIACADEAEATALARQLLGYFQGTKETWSCTDQRLLRHLIPEDRVKVYDIRQVISALADDDSVLEIRPDYGFGMVTALVRIEGRPFGLIANNPRHLGGAIDSEGGEKGARFLQLCDTFAIPIISLCDTPGYMVGPDSEKTAAVRRGSRLIVASANLTVPLFTVVLRKGYGLGAQAMAGGGFHQPFFTIAWPTSEFGPMGLEGAVELGYRKELDAIADDEARRKLYDELVANMYEKGKGVSVAQVFEIDAVIDPAETRAWLLKGLRSAGPIKRGQKRYVDVW
jgi:acetyl/propionyl-CoA carboxylase alpha subunit/acetyl-CoA carboxylase carboxyltransferase component